MVKPFARSSGMDILKYSRPPRATPLRWARRGPIRRILFNYLNRLRKKLISALIYFISFFSLLPTRSPRNRCDRAPLTYPSGSASRMIPPPSCLQFLVACCVKSSSGCRLRPRSDLFSYFFVASFCWWTSQVENPTENQAVKPTTSHKPHMRVSSHMGTTSELQN